jgi:hypothetical protein
MAGTPTTRYGLPTMAGTDFIADINEWTASAMAAIDAKMSGYAEGTLAARPTSTSGSPGVAGRVYRATDTGQWFLDTGTGWAQVTSSGAPASGKAIIATSQTLTGAGYALMPTPDRVSGLVLPTDGLIAVVYQATWNRSSTVSTPQAAIHINTSGAVAAQNTTAGGPTGLQAQTSLTGSAGVDVPLASYPGGLFGNGGTVSYTGDVTTGQIQGVGTGVGATYYGGPAYVFAAAGTYDISVRFNVGTTTLTVKNRKLWAWVVAP